MSSFDADIARYSEVQNNIQKEETNITINFVLVDSTPIKTALIKLCQEWQEKFTQVRFHGAREQAQTFKNAFI